MKKLIKIIGSVLLIFFGLVGLYYETGKYYEFTLNENDKRIFAQNYKIMHSAFYNLDNNELISEGLLRRNYSYGYIYKYKLNDSYNDVLVNIEEQLKRNGYKTVFYTSNQKLKGYNDKYAIEIYPEKSKLYLTDNDIWCMYIKPNDIFEWTYLDFGSFKFWKL